MTHHDRNDAELAIARMRRNLQAGPTAGRPWHPDVPAPPDDALPWDVAGRVLAVMMALDQDLEAAYRRLETANPQGGMVRRAITQGALDDAVTYVTAMQRQTIASLETVDETASDALRVKVGKLARAEALRDVVGWLEGLRDGTIDLEDVNRLEAPAGRVGALEYGAPAIPDPATHPIAPMQPLPPIALPARPTPPPSVARFLDDPTHSGTWTAQSLPQVAEYVRTLERTLDLEDEAFGLRQETGAAIEARPERPEGVHKGPSWDHVAGAHTARVEAAETLRRARAATSIGGAYVHPIDLPCPACPAAPMADCRPF